MSEVKVNKISPRTNCGTVTLGDSGDSFVIPAGATITNNGTQTGFGRTGTVDWDTTAKTASFTAVSGNGYFVNTTSGAITVTLPATPSAGDIVSVSDYANTSATNNITVARNGSNIEGSASDLTIENNGIALTFVYVDGTRGWKVVDSGKEADKSGVSYIQATGGTITTCGDYKIHTFTGPSTFCVSCAGDIGTVDYLVVAGGAGGGGWWMGGGGGAGGYRESSGTASGCYSVSPLGAGVAALPVSITGYPITVGSGGSGGLAATPRVGVAGSNSIFSTITSTGGGFGGFGNNGDVPTREGGDGGSGGGGGGQLYTTCIPGGSGNTPPVSPPQGNNGGRGAANTPGLENGGGGGGGATAVGGNASNSGGTQDSNGGNGGTGGTNSINGTPTQRAGGGGGGGNLSGGSASGGGGAGATGTPSATSGSVNTGGGGGGAGYGGGGDGGSGGSGIVIIRYKFQ